MATRRFVDQSALLSSGDSATGVTRDTAKRLGASENEADHLALCEIADEVFRQYEADEGPLTDDQVRQIKKRFPQGTKKSVRSSLLPESE